MTTHAELMTLGEQLLSECFAYGSHLEHTVDCMVTLDPGSTNCSCGLGAMWNQLVMTAATLATTYGTGELVSTHVVQST